MTHQLWRFKAVDTLFFRESRPFDTVGGAQLKSTFPPPVRTLVGAIRTAVGEANGVDWHNYQKGPEYEALRRSMGDAHGFGKLDFRGPFLMKENQRLYPVPLLLLKEGEEVKEWEFHRLQPGEPVQCDLGKVRLPVLGETARGAKPLEDYWLTRDGLRKVLLGETPDIEDLYQRKEIYAEEERLGIGRDNYTRSNMENLLYQTRHIRPGIDTSFGIYMRGLDDTFREQLQNGVNKLGGEGRLGAFEITEETITPFEIPTPKNSTKVLLTLLTAGDFGGDWVLPEFRNRPHHNCDAWEGEINGVPLRIISATIGKPLREGGWNVAGRQSRPLQSLVPAGSCYFCEVMHGGAQEAIEKLQGHKIGKETEIGRGELAVGIW